MTDLISELAGIEPGSPVDSAFGNRAEARANAEASYRLLVEPDDPRAVSLTERRAVAAFVAALHHEEATRQHYRGLIEADNRATATAVLLAASEALANGEPGPWGSYPPGPLSDENVPGTPFRVGEAHRRTLGPRLTAAVEHAHLLVFHPRDASRAALQALLDAGWTTDGIVTLSQLVAFLTFQIRVVAGLRAVADARATRDADTAIPA